MQVTKATVKKQIEVEDGESHEFIDVRLQIDIDPNDSYEDLRAMLIKRLDKRFNELFAAELGLMPDRIKEGEHWKQQGMFSDPL